MAKYQKAIDVYAPGVADAIRQGKINLQKGQWIKIGDNPKLSRFHHANEYNICAFHYPRHNTEFVLYARIMNERAKGVK
jgi:hypothetical protein